MVSTRRHRRCRSIIVAMLMAACVCFCGDVNCSISCSVNCSANCSVYGSMNGNMYGSMNGNIYTSLGGRTDVVPLERIVDEKRLCLRTRDLEEF